MDNLRKSYDDVTSMVDEGKTLSIVYLDFSKAFNTYDPTDRLLHMSRIDNEVSLEQAELASLKRGDWLHSLVIQ